MSGPDPKRRFSRPELPSGISAIFNPRKLRRNSTAISQLINEQQAAGQPPSLSEQQHRQDSFGDDYNLGGSTSSLYMRMANGPPASSYHGSNISEGRRVHIGSASSGASASSVPLLTEMQAHGSGMMTSFDGSSSGPHHIHYSQQLQQNNNNNPSSNQNSKPLTRTLAAIRRAIFSKTARKVK